MNRQQYENLFLTIKPLVYTLTNPHPEIAHHLFIHNLNFIVKHLDIEQILGFDGLEKKPLIDLAPAAGFNKNGTIHSDALHYLGFTKNVVGSITSIKHKGNKHTRCWRIYESESLVNRLGLPGVGVDKVYDNLEDSYFYAKHQLPIEINLVPHPTVDDKIKDIEYCVNKMADIHFVEFFTLNISCPNTDPKHRDEYQKNVVDLLEPIFKFKKLYQKVKLKVSPDMDELGIDQILRVIEDLDVYGIETTNTTTFHDPNYISVSPTDKPAGASGPALFHRAKNIQQLFEEKSNGKYVFDAVGGIRDIQTAEERITPNTEAIKIYTAMVYQGPKIVRELRTYLNERGDIK